MSFEGSTILSIIIPCFNEEKTLEKCVRRVIQIGDQHLALEIIIVDDCSQDNSYQIALKLQETHSEIILLRHKKNMGKGAALRSGFQKATGSFIAVQDADLEYDPKDLKRLLVPLIKGEADVVLGSRFLSSGVHRVLYFYHFLGNRFLTLLSNMFTDLNLSDMETCYKVFRKEIIKSIEIQENRFGFEPEIIAKVAQMRVRIFEMGISYYGRTYAEGKKIGIKDGFRALYCIFRYNAHKAPLPIQLLIYFSIGAIAAIVNFLTFLLLLSFGIELIFAAPTAFSIAAAVNYLLCIKILFRHKARWNSATEAIFYIAVVAIAGLLDLGMTQFFVSMDFGVKISKLISTVSVFLINFVGRRFLVFPEKPLGHWKPQEK